MPAKPTSSDSAEQLGLRTAMRAREADSKLRIADRFGRSRGLWTPVVIPARSKSSKLIRQPRTRPGGLLCPGPGANFSS